jgi:hypothetical protein
MPKMGRPTTAPKINQYRIRLTDAELDTLNKCCELTGLNKSDVVRLGLKMVYDANK